MLALSPPIDLLVSYWYQVWIRRYTQYYCASIIASWHCSMTIDKSPAWMDRVTISGLPWNERYLTNGQQPKWSIRAILKGVSNHRSFALNEDTKTQPTAYLSNCSHCHTLRCPDQDFMIGEAKASFLAHGEANSYITEKTWIMTLIQIVIAQALRPEFPWPTHCLLTAAGDENRSPTFRHLSHTRTFIRLAWHCSHENQSESKWYSIMHCRSL